MINKYLCLLGFIILYSPIIYRLYTLSWKVIDYTHAYFILPLFLWMIWRDKNKMIEKRNLNISKFSDILSVLIMISGCLLYIMGWRHSFTSVSTFSLIPILTGYFTYVMGFNVLKAIWFPLSYLLLMIPPPLGVLDAITIPLRFGVTRAVEWFLSLLKYPINREGLLLFINDHKIYMGAPCSGFRSLVTLISLGLIYVYISKLKPLYKLLLGLLIIPMALIGNFLRVSTVCIVMNHFGENIAMGVHDYGGYAVFIILILGLIGFELLFLRLEKNE